MIVFGTTRNKLWKIFIYLFIRWSAP